MPMALTLAWFSKRTRSQKGMSSYALRVNLHRCGDWSRDGRDVDNAIRGAGRGASEVRRIQCPYLTDSMYKIHETALTPALQLSATGKGSAQWTKWEDFFLNVGQILDLGS